MSDGKATVSVWSALTTAVAVRARMIDSSKVLGGQITTLRHYTTGRAIADLAQPFATVPHHQELCAAQPA
jgi:hypothetical protein